VHTSCSRWAEMLVFSKLVSLMRVLKYCGPSSDFSRNILLGVDDGLSEARCRIRTIFCPPPLLREGFLLFPSAVGAILGSRSSSKIE